MTTKERNIEIYKAYLSGKKYTEIAKEFDLTSPRIRDIVNKIKWHNRRKLNEGDDPLFRAYDDKKITTATYQAIKRAGYKEKFDITWLIDKLKSDELKPTEIRNLGKVGISQLKKALL